MKTHFNNAMEGLTAKVFRTFRASHNLYRYLVKIQDEQI